MGAGGHQGEGRCYMIYFSLPHILKASPYDIVLSEGDFIFETDKGIRYEISFNKEDLIKSVIQ